MSIDPLHAIDDVSTNPTPGPHFRDIVDARLARRSILGGAAALLGATAFGAAPAASAAPSTPAAPTAKGKGLLGFTAIPLSSGTEVVVPRGYTATAFIPWGTPILGSYPAFRPGRNTAAEQEQQIGMNHDGMHYFPLRRGSQGSSRGLLALNQEYTEEHYLQTGTSSRPARAAYTADMVRKSQAAHGVSVVEIEKNRNGGWRVVRSRFNRRITAYTPMTFSGPARGHRLLRTSADRSGTRPLGTFNNCASGPTPWNTYLTCEENFNGYFRVTGSFDADTESAGLIGRYGVGGDGYYWAEQDERFRVTPEEPNEPNRFGWVVEIDPFDPSSTPVKRTALGRFKHEGAASTVSKGGRVVVYMGDDQANEHVYKFVSAGNYRSMRARGRSPLDEGTLYVARFDDDGSGEWLPLVHGQGPLTAANGFADQGDVLVKTRLAASALGATKMDRPEWGTVDETTSDVYMTMTNNTSSSKEENAANPRKPNRWGHIIRWQEHRGDHTGTRFTWDLFIVAGQGRESGDGSTIAAEDAFGSPDGLWADPDGRVWIQTDGSQPQGANDQMLAADPTRTDADGVPEVRRFLTGVTGCEVTGITVTPDQTTMFANLQHPEGNGWPHNDGFPTVARSATVVVTKDDAGVVGT